MVRKKFISAKKWPAVEAGVKQTINTLQLLYRGIVQQIYKLKFKSDKWQRLPKNAMLTRSLILWMIHCIYTLL